MVKAKKVTITDDQGKQYVITGVNAAVPFLGIAQTTIRRHAMDGTPVDTKLGKVTVRIADHD